MAGATECRRRLHTGNQSADRATGRRDILAGRLPLRLFRCVKKRLQRRRPIQPQSTGPGRQRLRLGRHGRRRPLPGSPFRRPVRRIGLCAIGIVRRGTASDQIRLHGTLHRISSPPPDRRPPAHRLRRLEHRPQSHRLEKLARQPKELRFSTGGKSVDGRALRGRLVDAFRVVNQAPEQYTWWSNRGQARANNVAGASTTR